MNERYLPNYIENITLLSRSNIEISSPFKHVDAAFNWMNREYAIYHRHTHWEILVIVSGKIQHTINEQEREMKKGDCCLIRPEDRHSVCFYKGAKEEYQPCQYLSFTFDNAFAETILGLFCDYKEFQKAKDILYFVIEESNLNLIYNKAILTQSYVREEYVISTKLLISQILNSFWEQRLLYDPNYPIWLNEFLNYVSHPNNFGKSVDELSKSTAYSYSRLARLFKEYMGVTLIDYINEKKMIYAKRLLRTTAMTTLQISEMIGYHSLSSFNHLFKSMYGLTPSAYRKQERGNEKGVSI